MKIVALQKRLCAQPSLITIRLLCPADVTAHRALRLAALRELPPAFVTFADSAARALDQALGFRLYSTKRAAFSQNGNFYDKPLLEIPFQDENFFPE